jgi:hypothetical protein
MTERLEQELKTLKMTPQTEIEILSKAEKITSSFKKYKSLITNTFTF